MTDEPENLVLRMLRSIDAKMDNMAHDISDIKQRVGHLESATALLGTSLSHVSNRIDRVEIRLDRMEKRMGLVEA